MESSIPEILKASPQMSLPDIPNATSSLVSEDGAMPSDSQDGPTTSRYGLDRAHANLSAMQAKERGLLTSGTYGLHGSGSSSNPNLGKSLANRFHQRLRPGLGSTLYKMTWKLVATPAGRLIFRLAASARRIDATDTILVPWGTPNIFDSKGMEGAGLENRQCIGGCANIKDQITTMTHWPTVTKQANIQIAGQYGRADGTTLAGAAVQSAWTTAAKSDGKRHGGGITEQLTGSSLSQMSFMALGIAQTGHYAVTRNRGEVGLSGDRFQLNPHFSRWLMGYPQEFCDCAVTAMQSFRSSQRRSSVHGRKC